MFPLCLSCTLFHPVSALNILFQFHIFLLSFSETINTFDKSWRTCHSAPSLNPFYTPWKALHLIALKSVTHLIICGVCCHFCNSSSNRSLDRHRIPCYDVASMGKSDSLCIIMNYNVFCRNIIHGKPRTACKLRELRLPFQREGESMGPVAWRITTEAYYGKVFCHVGPWPLKRHCWTNCILPCLVSLSSDPGLAYRKGVLSTVFTNTMCSGCSNSLQLSARHKLSMNHLGTVKF